MSSLAQPALTSWKTGDGKDLDTNISLSLGILFSFCYPFALCCKGRDRCTLSQVWSLEKEKVRPLPFERKARKLLSQLRSLLAMQCMHFPNASVSDTNLHTGHAAGRQFISQLQTLSPCLLGLARLTKAVSLFSHPSSWWHVLPFNGTSSWGPIWHILQQKIILQVEADIKLIPLQAEYKGLLKGEYLWQRAISLYNLCCSQP